MMFLTIIGLVFFVIFLIGFIITSKNEKPSLFLAMFASICIMVIPHMCYYYNKTYTPGCITISVDNNIIYQGPERLVGYIANNVTNTNNDLNPIKIYKVTVYTDEVYSKSKTIYEGNKIYSIESCKEDK